MTRTRFQDTDQDMAAFPATTRILTPGGQRPIASLSRGAPVLAFDPAAGRMVLSQVLRVKVLTEAARIWTIAVENGPPVLETSGRQSFLTDRGWVEARDLQVGDKMRRVDADGRVGLSEITSLAPCTRFPPTFSLVTSGPGTYVTDGAVAHAFTVMRGPRMALVNTRYRLARRPQWHPLPGGVGQPL